MNNFTWPEKGIQLTKQYAKRSKPDKNIPNKMLDFHEQEWYPCINNAELWAEYMDEEMYYMEVWLRQWLTELSKEKLGPRDERKKMTTRYALECCYGEDLEEALKKRVVLKMANLLMFYSATIKKHSTNMFRGEKTRSYLFWLSPARLKVLPYGLRLRFEELQNRGKIPNVHDIGGWKSSRYYCNRIGDFFKYKDEAGKERFAWYRDRDTRARREIATQKARARYEEYKNETEEQTRARRERTAKARQEYLKRRWEAHKNTSAQENGGAGPDAGAGEDNV